MLAAAVYPLFVRLHPAVQHRSLLCRAQTWPSSLHKVDLVSRHVAYETKRDATKKGLILVACSHRLTTFTAAPHRRGTASAVHNTSITLGTSR